MENEIMIDDQFEKFWEFLIKKAEESEYTDLDEWLKKKFLKYIAEKKPPGWHFYIEDIYDHGYISKEVYQEAIQEW